MENCCYYLRAYAVTIRNEVIICNVAAIHRILLTLVTVLSEKNNLIRGVCSRLNSKYLLKFEV